VRTNRVISWKWQHGLRGRGLGCEDRQHDPRDDDVVSDEFMQKRASDGRASDRAKRHQPIEHAHRSGVTDAGPSRNLAPRERLGRVRESTKHGDTPWAGEQILESMDI
jgi:hypothetical protein